MSTLEGTFKSEKMVVLHQKREGTFEIPVVFIARAASPEEPSLCGSGEGTRRDFDLMVPLTLQDAEVLQSSPTFIKKQLFFRRNEVVERVE